MWNRFSLRALLIVVTASCVTASQRPTHVTYAPFLEGEHNYSQRLWLPDGRAVIAGRVPNPGFVLPGLAAGMWFVWGYLERRRIRSYHPVSEDR